MLLATVDRSTLCSVADLVTQVLSVAVRDVDTGHALMVAHASRQAVEESMEHREAVFWSTSKDARDVKGSTSGNFLELIAIRVNCEGNSLLYRVDVRGARACHLADDEGRPHLSCLFRTLDPAEG